MYDSHFAHFHPAFHLEIHHLTSINCSYLIRLRRHGISCLIFCRLVLLKICASVWSVTIISLILRAHLRTSCTVCTRQNISDTRKSRLPVVQNMTFLRGPVERIFERMSATRWENPYFLGATRSYRQQKFKVHTCHRYAYERVNTNLFWSRCCWWNLLLLHLHWRYSRQKLMMLMI